MKQLLFRLFGRRNTKDLYYRLTREPLHFSEVEIISDYFSDYPREGVMLDVGVHYGESCAPYLQAGWQVLGFEPDKTNRLKIPKHPKLTLYTNAVSDIDGQEVNFYASEESTGISSLSAFRPSHQVIDTVTTITLATALQQTKPPKVDFLKIDIEGHDFFALKGFPFDTHAPDVITCEFEDYKTVPLGYTYQDLGDFLLSQSYSVWLSEWQPIVLYGQQHVWRSIKPYPVALTDSQGWGNFIAVKHELKADFEKVLSRYMASYDYFGKR